MVDISIVIPTYNRIHRIEKLIAALESQSYPKDRFEVLIVSDGGNDGTHEYLTRQLTGFQLRPIFQENAGVAAARNTGASNAKGDILLFLDDDILPNPNLVWTHVAAHANASMFDMVVGPMLTPNDWQLLPWVAWEQAMLERQYNAMIAGRYKPTARQFYTGNASIMREFFFANDCFDPRFRRAEDVEFAYRAIERGGRIIFNPEARSYHYAERSFESWSQTAYTYGQNDVIFTREKGINWLLPLLLHEYHSRNVFIRGSLFLYLDRIKEQERAVRAMKIAGEFAYQKKQYKLSQIIFSGIFNLRYYQGIADQLGGRKVFFAMLRKR